MAEWRSRKYVPDSDDEEVELNSVHTLTPPPENADLANDEFLDIDELAHEEGNKDPLEQISLEREDALKPIDERENVTNFKGAKAPDDSGKKIQPVTRNSEGSPIRFTLSKRNAWGSSGEENDIDELQQDHISMPKAKPAAEALRTPTRKKFFPDGDVSRPNGLQLSLSPLSSVPSSPLTPPPQTPPSTFYVEIPKAKPANQVRTVSPVLQRAVLELSQNNLDSNKSAAGISKELEVHTQPGPSGRTFRQRNPIQVHPYALEGEKYRQSLKARGLKPLRIVQEKNKENGPKDTDLETQEYDAGEDSQPIQSEEDTQCFSSSPLRKVNSPPGSQQQTLNFDGDDFPDVDTILRQPPAGTVHQGFKRRKTTHKYSKASQTLARHPVTPLHIPAIAPDQNTASNDDFENLFDIPPSPPRTRGSSSPITSARALDAFRYPPTVTSNDMPTPVTSSDPRSRPALEVVFDEESEIGQVHVGSDSEEGFTYNGLEDDEVTAYELLCLQRRMRGVLPASFASLEFKAQAKKSTKATSLRPSDKEGSPHCTAMPRGVARPVVSRIKRSDQTSTLSYPIEISDDDSESHIDNEKFRLVPEATPAHNLLPRLGGENSQPDPWLDSMDIQEDDRIDSMLPSTKRRPSLSRNPKIRQTKLTDISGITRAKKDKSPSQKRKRNRTDHAQEYRTLKRRKSVIRPPQLGILDATSQHESGGTAMPSFNRIASRTARLRSDAGRHSPSKKYIRLTTRQDTLDAQETLTSWRSGSLAREKSRARASTLSRKPLVATTGNEHPRPRPPSVPREQDRRNSKSVDGRQNVIAPRPKSKQARSVQYKLRPFLERRLAVLKDRKRSVEPNKRPRVNKKTQLDRARLLSSLHRLDTGRPALVESVLEEHGHSSSLRDRSDHILQTNISVDPVNEEFKLDKYFEHQDSQSEKPVESHKSILSQRQSETREGILQARNRLNRKKPPRHLNTRTASFIQSDELNAISQEIIDVSDNESVQIQSTILKGLGPFRTQYTTSFDIAPLPTGKFFAKDSFIGSGAFARSLAPISRDLDLAAQEKVIKIGDEIFHWGPWTDTVSSQLSLVNEQIINVLRGLHSQVSSASDLTAKSRELICLQESIIEYFTENISFFDPIDRNSCLQRCISLMLSLKNEVDQLALDPANCLETSKANVEKLDIAVCIRILIQLNCLSKLANDEIVPSSIKTEIKSLLLAMIRFALQLTVCNGLGYVVTFLDSCSNIESIHWNEHHQIESIVVLYHIAKSNLDSMALFRETICKYIIESASVERPHARILDRAWKNLFALLPLFEFDVKGILRNGQRYKEPYEMWPLVKRLVDPALEVYLLNTEGQNVTYNAYIRAIFGRCFHLIKEWGWSRCELIIGTLFDFFARNNLAHLNHEESCGSPTFLEHLTEISTIHLAREDLCFHVLLKIIGTGLRAMRQVHLPKKISDTMWRLMPNHGRNHPKDESIRQEDLDALQNHHDLLSILYWASPAKSRPRLTAVRNLVSLESSHRAACHTSIRAWSNLARYQVSTNEPLSTLEQFADWYSDLLNQILRQHRLARIEVESQAKIAESTGKDFISDDIREKTIARNQRQVEAVLSDALVSLKNAIDATPNVDAVKVLFTTSLSTVIDSFDAQNSRMNPVILQFLDIVSAVSRRFQDQTTNDDSQDFGDWTAFEEEGKDSSETTAEYVQESLLDPMSRLMSNCFGSDMAVDDVLLQRLVETWVLAAKVAVCQGVKSWNDFLSPYGQNSWSSLRDTEQTRKFTAYFLALLIQDTKAYQEHKLTFHTSWMASLVERESLLKFQHVFTESILNQDSENPLLSNLPFGSRTEERLQVSITDFRQRRLSLISCILSNMRESLDFNVYHNLNEKASCKREYTELLKTMMTAMKRNYQELGNGSSVRGAYVEFAQRVIGFLQQHTGDFCIVDRFFTDSAAFPLPATDPTYVVGRLRNYKLRLQDSRTPKQLSTFVQTVSERAAIDNQQLYLAEQLSTAMSNIPERGDRSKPTLRSFLIQVVFPAYIELSFSTSCGWVFGVPVLEAIKATFGTIIEDLDGTSQASVDSVGCLMVAFLDAVRRSSELLVDHAGLLEQPTILKILSMCFSTIVVLLPTLSYIARLPFPLSPAVDLVAYLRSFADFATISLSGDDDFPDIPREFDEGLVKRLDDAQVKMRTFAVDELREMLQRNWACHDGKYYNTKGGRRRQVAVLIGTFEDERREFLSQAQGFCKCLAGFPALNDEYDE
ncbi:hypothetical protein MMC14_006219 [Varicellaria rhodocarpa]|nr:hypothetical protein [Varicellaria rhodocarpa]